MDHLAPVTLGQRWAAFVSVAISMFTVFAMAAWSAVRDNAGTDS
jgi:hypothetical protein